MPLKRDRSRAPLSSSSRRPPLNYYRSGSESYSPPPQKHKNRKLKRPIVFMLDILVGITVLLVLVSCLFVKSDPQIYLNSQAYHPISIYQLAAQQELKKVKYKTKLTFDEKSLIDNLQKKYPEIDDARVELPLFSQSPKIFLDISAPSIVMVSNSASFVLDSHGRATTDSSALSSSNLPVVQDQTSYSVKRGQQVLSTSAVSFIKQVIAQSKRSGVSISSLSLPSVSQELDLRTKDRPYYVKFNMSGDGVLQSGEWLAARRNFDNNNTQPGQYLDVRVAGKVYYK